MIAVARLGGVLTIVGIAAIALMGIGGILGVGGIMPTYFDPAILAFVSILLLGSGAVAIGLSDSGVLAASAPRAGLLLFAMGCVCIAAALLAAKDVVPGSLGVGSGLNVLAGAGLLAPIGLLVMGVSLARSSGLAMIAGLCICLGGGLAVLGLFSSSVLGYDTSRGILLLGASIVGAGMVSVGLLAGGVGRRPSDGTIDRCSGPPITNR